MHSIYANTKEYYKEYYEKNKVKIQQQRKSKRDLKKNKTNTGSNDKPKKDKRKIKRSKRNHVYVPTLNQISVKNYQKSKLQWFLNIKDGLKCKFCTEDFSHCLDFHHIDPKTKLHNISTMANKFMPNNLILEEMGKCIVICANCHRKIHWVNKELTKITNSLLIGLPIE